MDFKGKTIDTQRIRVKTESLSEFCSDFVEVFHTGGDDSVASMLFTNAEARYLAEVLNKIIARWENHDA